MKYKKVLLVFFVLSVTGAAGLLYILNRSNQINPRYVKDWGTVENWELSKQNETVLSKQEKVSENGTTTIDFSLCRKGVDAFGFGSGSTTFNFLGIDNGNCHFYMGTEIESPTWDGYLNRECSVPINFQKEFVTTDSGATLTFDKEYCTG